MTAPKFGVIYSRLHDEIPPARFAASVEQLGFDSVWATEGLVNQLPALDPLIMMAGLVHGSKTLTVGSCVILSPLRNAALLAKEAVTLDILSSGRFVLGIAVGGSSMANPGDYAASGIDPSERGARCDEGIEVMKKFWTGVPVSHRGRFYNFDDIYMLPKPVQRPNPPIWVGGNADGAAKRAGRLGDGFVPIGEGPDNYKKLWGRLCEAAAAAGRDPSRITRAVHVFFRMDESRSQANALAEKTLTERYGFQVTLEDDGRHPFGTADDCARVIESYLAAGVEHFVLNTVRALPEVHADIEKFAEKILPRFR